MGHPRRFRFGIINELPQPAAGWLAHVRRVEEYGYATFLIRDHFVPDYFGDQLAPLIALATAAQATSRLRLGTLVLSNDYRHPVVLAKEAATLDVLSGGRLELGIGAGWLRAEYEQAGMLFEAASVRIGRLDEAIQVIKGLFGAAPLTFEGRHYTVRGLSGYPQPTQQPYPPILIGAGQRNMLRLAGRHADIVGILTSSVARGTLDDAPDERLAGAVAQKLAWVREGAGARFDAIELSLVPTMIIDGRRRERTEQLIRERGWANISVEQVWGMPAMFIGSIEQIVEDMQARREQYDFSYYVFSDTQMEQCAPIVARLAGI